MAAEAVPSFGYGKQYASIFLAGFAFAGTERVDQGFK